MHCVCNRKIQPKCLFGNSRKELKAIDNPSKAGSIPMTQHYQVICGI